MTIRHSQGEYQVILTTIDEALRAIPQDARVITDRHVAEIFTTKLEPSRVLILEPGEAAKSLAIFGQSLRWLAESGAARQTSVVALGGGVIGDLAGFVAASYMRGVPFIQIPTTLLAQVDSSVGGKVGLDLPEGKNLVGAFYPPQVVYLCPDALAELPVRQLRNGMAEVLKYGFIMDPELFKLLPATLPIEDACELQDAVARCIELKAKIVEEDEHETTGRRAILNFGHTVGHAIEQLTGYGPVLHGEAISIGMVVETRLGERIGVTEPGVAREVREMLERHGLPVTHPILRQASELLQAMRRDKKAVDGRLAFSLLTRVGECKLVRDVAEADVSSSLDEP